MEKIVKMCGINKTYNSGKENEIQVLHNISLEINSGELVAVMGKSGAGKSTLMRIIACTDCEYSGQYELEGKDVSTLTDTALSRVRNQKIGIVVQDFALIEDFSVYENICLPLDIKGKRSESEKKNLVSQVLEKIDLQGLMEKEVGTMSGGEKQRVAIARAIVQNPSLLIADEPTGALDSINSQNIMDLFKKLNQMGKTIIIVTHDFTIADQCDRMITLKDGKIIS